MKYWFVYIIGPHKGPYKIGMSCDPIRRVRELVGGSRRRLNLWGTLKCHSQMHAAHVESGAHIELSAHRAFGEWFNVPVSEARAAVVVAARRLNSDAGQFGTSLPEWMPGCKYPSKTALLLASLEDA